MASPEMKPTSGSELGAAQQRRGDGQQPDELRVSADDPQVDHHRRLEADHSDDHEEEPGATLEVTGPGVQRSTST